MADFSIAVAYFKQSPSYEGTSIFHLEANGTSKRSSYCR